MKPAHFNFLILSLLFLAPAAQARVFSYKSSWVAAHLAGSGGTTSQGSGTFSNTSGSGTQFTDTVKYDFSGEFGFSFLMSENFTMRLGFEGVQSKSIDAKGGSSAGTNWMTVTSQSTVFNPNLTFEDIFFNNGSTRMFAFFGAGYAMAKVNNTYNVNAAGQTQYAGAPATFGDTWAATNVSAQVGGGLEFFLVDNVTLSFQAGYRYMNFPKLTYASAGSGFSNGTYQTVASGATVNDSFGHPVHLDMSGPFVGIMIRFFIPPLN